MTAYYPLQTCGKKTHAKGRVENYTITTIKTKNKKVSKKKNIWRLSFKNSAQDLVFLPFTGPKKSAWNNLWSNTCKQCH